MSSADPYTALGLGPGAGPADVAAAYRRAAKRWHPDRRGGSVERMAAINEAYALLLAGDGRHARAMPDAEVPRRRESGPPRRGPAGAWLPERLRLALGPEVLTALQEREPVMFVTTATFSGSAALLALTDRRLLWLLDDAVTGRVRMVGLHAIAAADQHSGWRRRSASLHLRTTGGRRLRFTGLNPTVAGRLVAELRGSRGQ